MSPDPKIQLEVSESAARVGATDASRTEQVPSAQGSGAAPEFHTLVYADFDKYVAELHSFSGQVAAFVGVALFGRF